MILKGVHIPTSIGIGKTKTLAKVANFIAKKKLQAPVFDVSGHEARWLDQLEVSDIWGIGRQWSKKLNSLGIFTAKDLAQADQTLMRQKFGVVMQRVIMELNGIACLELEEPEPRQSIMSSCSFGGLQSNYEYIQEAISHHCATASAKMRKQGLITQYLSVFVRSNPFREDTRQYANSIGFRLINPTDDVRIITKWAKYCLKRIYQPGIFYHKSGVLLNDLTSKLYYQTDLFNQPTDKALTQSDSLMHLIDSINHKYGARTLRLAAEGFQKSWSMKRQLMSPCYTTRWADLPVAYT